MRPEVMTTYTSRSGQLIELSKEMVFHILGKGNEKIDELDLRCYIALCQELRLNPFVPGEVHLIKYDSSKPAQIVVGKQAFIRIAEDNPNYVKRESGVTILNCEKKIEHRIGSAIYPPLEEVLLGGWCTVWYKRDGLDSIETRTQRVALQEYDTHKSLWSSKPGTMIEKVAVVQCLREAFPNDYKGAYSEDEISPTSGPQEPFAPQAPVDPVVTQAQRKEMFEFAKQVFGEQANEELKKILSQFGHTSTEKLKESELIAIMDVINNHEMQNTAQDLEIVQETEEPETTSYDQ